MKRKNVRLYRENRWTGDGRRLHSTRLPVEPIPLVRHNTWEGYDPAGVLVGSVTNVRRGRWGWVLGTLVSWEWEFSGLYCEAEFDQAIFEHDHRRRTIVTDARLCSVALGDRPCWPGMRIR